MFRIAAISAVCAVAAWSQIAPEQTKIQIEKHAFGPIGITAALGGPMSTVAGAPYSAQAVTQRVQTLADGNRITQTTTNSVARDGKGRVRREESLPALPDGVEAPHLVLIEDPVAGVHITLDANTKTAMRLSTQGAKKEAEAAAMAAGPGIAGLGVPGPGTAGPVVVSMGAPGPGLFQITTDGKTDPGANAVDLGTQTIEGVPAKGKKFSHTIPAGEMGNDLPIVITTETWYSPDLKVSVMTKSSDPRMGETTYRLTNILRAEPDPSLFQIPSDYTVKDQAQNVFYFKSTGEK
jgi:hypothetical protein